MNDRPLHLKELSSDQKKIFREKYDVFFFDKDCTLITFLKKPITGVPEAIATLSNLGKQLHLYTDSCFDTREALTKDIKADFPEFKAENIVNSSWLLTKHLKDIGFNKKIYAMGELKGIVKELKDAGFEVEDDVDKLTSMDDAWNMKLDPEVGAVVLGFDINFSGLKLLKAINYLRKPETLFLISHSTISAKFNYLYICAGGLALTIEKISQRKPITCGKSSPVSIDYIHSLGYDMSRCLFVGDGLDSDIACGNLCGMDTLLVLSGTCTLEDVERARQRGDLHLVPTYVGGSVADLGDIFSRV